MTMSYYRVSTKNPTGWFHLTIIYHGTGNGLSVYYDGELMGNTKTSIGSLYDGVPSSGKMAIGKEEYDVDDKYATMVIDELTLWNN